MNDIYVIWESVGINGIDKYLVPLLDIAPTEAEQKPFRKIIVRQLANGFYEYIQTGIAFKPKDLNITK
jgi:hypothetical protein